MHNINVLLDTSPLQSGSKTRGIGMYTRMLQQALEDLPKVTVIPIADKRELRGITKKYPEITVQNTVLHYPFFDLFFSTLPYFRAFKTVVTVHDVIPLKFPDHYKPGFKGSIRSFKQIYKLKGVDAVITDSQASSHDIEHLLGISTAKLHVVYLAAANEVKHQPDDEVIKARRLFKIPQNYVLYVGDINYNKNIPQLIKMVKYLPEHVHLVCVGKNFVPQEIPEWKAIELQLAMSDVSSRVHFVSTIEARDTQTLSALYSGAVAYIQPSLYEGFGLPVLEAMQAKCPVIATNVSSLPEVVGAHGLLVSANAEGFAEAVKEVMNWSDHHRQTVIRNAYNWSQTFSWARVAEETEKVYRLVLGTDQ